MFDLNIDHYSKNDIEELFNLKGTLYNNEDVEDSMNTIKEQMDHEVGVDVKVKDATLNFLLTAKKLLIDVQPDLITNQVLEDGVGKAGGYALQNFGSRFVKKIRGCYTNVIGISIPELYKILKNPEL